MSGSDKWFGVVVVVTVVCVCHLCMYVSVWLRRSLVEKEEISGGGAVITLSSCMSIENKACSPLHGRRFL